MKFEIINLMKIKNKNGNLYGPIPQGIARIHFDDPSIHSSTKEKTYYDTLLVLTHNSCLTMWVDTGIAGIPIAISWKDDDQPTISKIYKELSTLNIARKYTLEQKE